MKTARLQLTLLPLLLATFNSFALVIGCGTFVLTGRAGDQTPPPDVAQQLTQLLDAPLLFVRRHSYTNMHIYDTYYKWPPGGGGIYLLENPSAPRSEWIIRPIIDPETSETRGFGVYSHPELSWDGKCLLFCFKGQPQGNTSIFEIGVDGSNLRRVTNPGPACGGYKGSQSGQHDIAPAYLPDGRIVFLSTRQNGLVPCNNTGVAVLHVMNPDGTDIHPISVNYVNEFDPSVLPDGRILYGRWEYVDKNALTIQSLWTCNPDGTQETALYANNMVFPEAILDTRPVPGSPLLAGTLAKHNGPPRGSIAFLDPRAGKNNPQALTNLERPDQPTHDLGDSCEPWPLNEDVVIFSGRPPGATRNAIQMMDRAGHRFTLLDDPDICLHSPMLVKRRPVPPIVPVVTDRKAATGRFLVQDVYQGLDGVKRGDVKWLRVIEETSRVSPSTMGGSPYNQTFLVSAALAFSVKNYLGLVSVTDEGSAYFEAPAGRALYFQALDGDGRLVQSMRTFIQASPGATRSCLGCHENKSDAPPAGQRFQQVLAHPPSRLQPESWGGGHLDYPSMVQPVLNRHCVSCHGGAQGLAAGLDLTGGWTEHFSISYENLVSRRCSQLEAFLIAGIDCMNGTAFWSSQTFAPRAHGSGAAPLAGLLLKGHGDAKLTRAERDLLMAWIDSNGLYHGSWDSTGSGCATQGWKTTRDALASEMQKTGCICCHGDQNGLVALFEEDWINLEQPELSRILRAPLPEGADGFGLGLCRNREVDPKRQRIRQLVNGYAHAVKPVEAFARRTFNAPDRSGTPAISFSSTLNEDYQSMLAIVRRGQELALAEPRVDMPGAKIVPGQSRQLLALVLPERLPVLRAEAAEKGVLLSWDRRSDISGMTFELHRSVEPGFTPSATTRLVSLTRFDYLDPAPPQGEQHYALILIADGQRSPPVRRAFTCPVRSSASTPPVYYDFPGVVTADAASFTGLLSSRSPERRVEGVQGLANLKHWAAENAVLRLLEDASPAVRREAVMALGRLGGARTIPRFIALLGDASWEIRQTAWLGLRAMTAEEFDGAERDAWEKWWAGSTLAEKGQALLGRARKPPESPGERESNVADNTAFVSTAPGRRARSRPLLSRPIHSVRRCALRALVHLGTPPLERALLDLLQLPQSPPLDPDERNFICEALERAGSPRAIPALATQKSDAAAWAIASLGGSKAERALLDFPKTLATLLALDRLHSTNAGPFLTQLVGQMGLITYRGQPDDVMNHDLQPIQRASANLIRRSGLAPIFFEGVLQELEDTMQPPLAHGPRPALPPDWEEMFRQMRSELKPGFVREDGTTTSQPVAALCYAAEDPALARRLIPLLHHPAVVVRVYVALTLGRLGSREAMPEIAAIIREGYKFSDSVALASGKHFDQSQTVRWRGFLCVALGRLGGDEARKALEEFASDPKQPRDIRYGAVTGLGFIGSPDSLPALKRVAENDIIWLVRDEARQIARNIQLTNLETRS